MDKFLSDELEKKQTQIKSPKTAEEYNQAYKQSQANMMNNLTGMEKLVDAQVFSGEIEKNAREKQQDLTHDYIYKSIKSSVTSSNLQVFLNVSTYGKAVPTEEDKNAKKAKELQKAEIINKEASREVAPKKAAEEAEQLEAVKRDYNDNADLNTVREYVALEDYTQYFVKYIQKNSWPSDYKKAVNAAGKGITDEKKKEKAIQMKHTEMLMTAVPFLKQYKKGWFGRKYTLDGERIKTKEGELSPDEYNKKLIKTLALETTKGKVDDKTLAKNRKAKAEMLSIMVKELLDFKLEPAMLTDDYLSKHITKLQEYADRCNALENLYSQNKWFFLGVEEGKATDAVDKNFYNLIEHRIFKRAEAVNDFLNEHYRTHGIYRGGEYTYTNKGIPVMDKPEVTDIAGRERYRKDRLNTFGYRFQLFNKNELSDQEKEEYGREREADKQHTYIRMRTLDDSLKDYDAAQRKKASEEVNALIQSEMKTLKEEAEKSYNRQVKPEDEIAKIPYETGATGFEGGIAIGAIRKKISENPAMYLYYGPEIDHLYARLYASVRLSSELQARKNALKKELDIDEQKKTDANGKSLSKFNYKSKNGYAQAFNGFIADDMRKRADEEYKDIAKKVELLDYNRNLCRKVLNFFLNDPKERSGSAEDLAEIKKFLNHEKLGYLFDVVKIDEYSELMDETLNETEARMYKKRTGEEMPKRQEEAPKEITREERGKRLFNVRRRIQEKKNLDDAQNFYILNDFDVDVKRRVQLFAMPASELSEFNYKTKLPVATEKQARITFVNYKYCEAAYMIQHNLDKGLSRESLYNRADMVFYLEKLKAQRLVPKDMAIDHFMADVQTKVELLSTQYPKLAAMWKLQEKNKDYPYFDTDKLSDMTDEELAEYITVLEEKQIQAEEDYKKISDGKSDYLKEKRGRRVSAIKELLTLVKESKDARKQVGDARELTGETYSHKYRKKYRAFRAQTLRETEFFDADEKYLDLKEIVQSDAYKNATKDWPPKEMQERRKEKKAPLPEAEMLESIKKKLLELESVPVDEKELLKMMETLDDPKATIDEGALIKLASYAQTVSDFGNVAFFEENEYLEDEIYKEMADVLDKPENVKLKQTIRARVTALRPLFNCVYSYLKSKNIRLYGEVDDAHLSKMDVFGKEKEERKRLQGHRDRYEEAKEKLSKNLKAYKEEDFDKKLQGYADKLFEEIYKSGEKLSIGELSKWQAKLKKMATKKSYFGDRENADWLRLCAQNMLDEWPYSFERFYVRRIKADTGKAFLTAVKNIGGDPAAELIDEKTSVNISEVINDRDTSIYNMLDDNTQKELDRTLLANGYDPKVFRYLLKPVQVNGVNQPIDERNAEIREQNLEIAKNFMAYAAQDKQQRVDTRKDGATYSWHLSMVENVSNVIRFDFQEEMLDEEYIRSNFAALYDMSRQFALVKELYEKEKDFFESSATNEFMINAQDRLRLKNLFGVGSNNIATAFFEMIDAYAKMHFVDERGVFDAGLSNEDINAEVVDKQGNFEKIRNEHEKRTDKFKEAQRKVGVELRRSRVANKMAEANRINEEARSINITGSDKVFKMVQKEDFSGNLDDANMLIHSWELMGYINKKSKYERDIVANETMIKFAKEKLAGGNLDPDDKAATEQLLAKNMNEQQLNRARRETADNKIKQLQQRNQEVFAAYTVCHDKNGELIASTKTESGEVVPLAGQFISYHFSLAPDMRRIFDEFEDFFKEKKALGNKNDMMDGEAISKWMMQEEFADKFVNYKRLNLYLGLLEKDTKGLAKNNPFFKELKKLKKEPGYADVRFMLKEVLKKNKETVDALHDYVNQVNAVVVEHGVGLDGTLLKEDITKKAGNSYSEEENLGIVHENQARVHKVVREQEKEALKEPVTGKKSKRKKK